VLILKMKIKCILSKIIIEVHQMSQCLLTNNNNFYAIGCDSGDQRLSQKCSLLHARTKGGRREIFISFSRGPNYIKFVHRCIKI
jgi:hypothetical protein